MRSQKTYIHVLLLVTFFYTIFATIGCGGGGGESQGAGNNSGAVSSVSTDFPTSLTDKDAAVPHYLYLKIAYTLDNGEVITYELDSGTLSAVPTQKSQSSPKNSYLSDILQARAPGGAWRIAYDKTFINLSGDMSAYITDKLVATKDAYSFGPGPNIAEEYIVCPEPSVPPEKNMDRDGVTVIPDPISQLGPITYSPSSPSFSGGFHIVANYVVPDEPGRPPKPWHESWDYYYDLNSPTPVLFRYFNGGGHWNGAEITLGLGSQKDSDEDFDDGDVPFPPLPRTLGPWHFIHNSNLSHLDDIINMRELSIKNAFVTPVQDFPNKVKIEAELEGLPEGTWQPENVTGECEIVNLDTQKKTTIILDWNSSALLLAGYFTFPAAVVAVYGSMMQSLLEDGSQHSYTLIAHDNGNKAVAVTRAIERKLTIQNVKVEYPLIPDSNPPQRRSDFKPGYDDEKVTITADIIPQPANFKPTELHCKVSVLDINKNQEIKTLFDGDVPFPSGSTKIKLEAIWSGKDKNGNWVAGDADHVFDDLDPANRPDYLSLQYKGSYTFRIVAKCKEVPKEVLHKEVVKVDHRPLKTSIYDQRGGDWGSLGLDHYNANERTIGQAGCAIASIGTLVDFHNGLFNFANPRVINQNFIDYGGFGKRGNKKGSVLWDKIKNCLNNLSGISKILRFNKNWINAYDSSLVDTWLKSNDPIIVYVHTPDPSNIDESGNRRGGHFVVLRGTMGEKHILSDPGYQKYYNDKNPEGNPTGQGFKVLYLEDYKKKDGILDAVYLYEVADKGASKAKNLEIVCSEDTEDSVEMGIFDTQGRYLGYEPSKNIRIPKDKRFYSGEIPDAQYFCFPIANLDGSGVTGGSKHLFLSAPPTGTYRLKVFGIDAAEYFWLTIVVDEASENVSVKGFVRPSQVVEYSIEFSQTVGVTPQIAVIGKLDFDPDILNLKSNGQYVTTYIELPEGYDIKNIDIETIFLESQISALSHPTGIGDHNGNEIPDLMVKFNRQALVSYLKSNGLTSGNVTLKVTGKVGDVSFQANDIVKVK